MDKKLPEIKEQVEKEKGILLYEDEAVFQVSGTKSKTWAPRGKGIEVLSKPARKSVKAFGAVTVEDNPHFHFRFAHIFNAITFLKFLKQLVSYWKGRKIHIILDNARYHYACMNRKWIEEHQEQIQLHFLPPYSPEFNAQERVWRITRRKITHNKFFDTVDALHKALFRQFNRFQGNPPHLRGVIASFK